MAELWWFFGFEGHLWKLLFSILNTCKGKGNERYCSLTLVAKQAKTAFYMGRWCQKLLIIGDRLGTHNLSLPKCCTNHSHHRIPDTRVSSCAKDWFHLNMSSIKAGPHLDLSFWSFLTFLHHGIEEVERHLLWKFHKKFKRKVGQMCDRSCSLA